MTLGWLFPLGLAALVGLVIPVLVHLAKRSEERPVVFAALRWLQQRPKPRQRLQWNELLLLIIRLLLLAVLAIYLAKPVIWGSEDKRPWVVVMPSADSQGALQPLDFKQVQVRWLVRDFPLLKWDAVNQQSKNKPLHDEENWVSLLRELDNQLPPNQSLTVMVPAELQFADAQRPQLSRAVEWKILPRASDFFNKNTDSDAENHRVSDNNPASENNVLLAEKGTRSDNNNVSENAAKNPSINNKNSSDKDNFSDKNNASGSHNLSNSKTISDQKNIAENNSVSNTETTANAAIQQKINLPPQLMIKTDKTNAAELRYFQAAAKAWGVGSPSAESSPRSGNSQAAENSQQTEKSPRPENSPNTDKSQRAENSLRTESSPSAESSPTSANSANYLEIQNVSDAWQAPDSSKTILWLSEQPLPAEVLNWVALGGTAVLAENTPLPKIEGSISTEYSQPSLAQVSEKSKDSDNAVVSEKINGSEKILGSEKTLSSERASVSNNQWLPHWRTSTGELVMEAQRFQQGRLLRFKVGLQPNQFPTLLDPEFPQQLQNALQPKISPPNWASASHYFPQIGGDTQPLPPRTLHSLWVWLLALLFLIERGLALSAKRTLVS